jgi:hypothetical protein
MKIFGNIVTYIELVLLLAATIFSIKYAVAMVTAPAEIWNNPPWENWQPYQYIIGAIGAGIMGVLITSLGIFIGRLRYICIILLVIGIMYCISMLINIVYPSIKSQDQSFHLGDFVVALIALLPGLACLIEGFILLGSKTRNQIQK